MRSITKTIVDLMGGTIAIESELGKGSEFIVDLCFARCEQKVEQQGSSRSWKGCAHWWRTTTPTPA